MFILRFERPRPEVNLYLHHVHVHCTESAQLSILKENYPILKQGETNLIRNAHVPNCVSWC